MAPVPIVEELMPLPEVSVVVGAYNAMPYLTQCVESVKNQSLAAEKWELIVVDDGSTDDTPAELKRLAADCPQLRVERQPNSGGPAAPRNRGLESARGRYVFFLDADDWIGVETLQRLLDMAEANGSDIVLGKMVGVGGRVTPKSMFECDQPKTDLFGSRVYWALNPLKLFRREFLETRQLRFPVDLPVGQDQPFTAAAYLRANVISVLSSYDCYYARLRPDGQNNTQRAGGAQRRLPFLRRVFALLESEVEAGPKRDQLLRRHFQSEQREFLDHLDRESDLDARRAAFDQFRELVHTWCTQSISDSLPAADRLRLELVRRDRMDEALRMIRFTVDEERCDVLVENGRVLADYPGFRRLDSDLPDALFDVTAELAVDHRIDVAEWRDRAFAVAGMFDVDRLDVSHAQVQLSLRERETGAEHRVLATVSPAAESAGFHADVDPLSAADGAPLPDGLWDVFARIETQGVVKTARIGRRRDSKVDDAEQQRLFAVPRHATSLVTSYYTKPFGNLSFDVGGQLKPWSSSETVQANWSDERPARLQVRGALPAHGPRADSLRLRLRRTGAPDRTVDGRVSAAATGFSGGVSTAQLEPGRWIVELGVDLGAGTQWAPVATSARLRSRLTRVGMWPALVRPATTGRGLRLTVESLRPVNMVRLLSRRWRR